MTLFRTLDTSPKTGSITYTSHEAWSDGTVRPKSRIVHYSTPQEREQKLRFVRGLRATSVTDHRTS